jgi:TetR/AcrR family transcriptional repressor of nem operon
MAASVEIFRQTLNGIWNTWAATIAGCIREAQALGEVERSVDAERAADALIEGWQGALIRAKLARDLGPLRGFVGYTLPTLLGLTPAAAPQPEEPR